VQRANQTMNVPEQNEPPGIAEPQPRRIHLPGFIKDEPVGLGDAIKRVTYFMGIKPCSGCERRAAALNRRVMFTR
jgi:hypothetical protein